MEQKKKKKVFFSDHLEDIFIKSVKKFPLPELGPASLANIFYLKTSSDSDKLKKFELYLHGPIVVLKKPKQKEAFGFMDVENTFLKRQK